MLNDGTKLTAKAPVSQSGQWPFYVSLYRNAGGCIGWVSFDTTTSVAAPQGVDWFSADGGLTELALDGSQYTAGPAFTNAAWAVTLSGGGLASNLVKAVTITAVGRVTVTQPGVDALKLTLTPKSGKLEGSFKLSVRGKAISFNGLLLQDQDVGAGLFQTTTGGPTGGITLEPVPTP